MSAFSLGFILAASPVLVAAAEPIVIGETTLPGGIDAFAVTAECLGGTDCGADIFFAPFPPFIQFFPALAGLTGAHILDVIAVDLRQGDEVLLTFPAPITNLPGPDLYLAQARFLSGSLGALDHNINDFPVRLPTSAVFFTTPVGAFIKDSVLPTQTVWYSDGQLQSSDYELWYALVDLSDLGLAPGESVTSLVIDGPPVPSFPDTAGLDIVTVASLTPTPGDMNADGFINGSDLAALLAQWGTNGSADLNGDGVVNGADLAALLANWG